MLFITTKRLKRSNLTKETERGWREIMPNAARTGGSSMENERQAGGPAVIIYFRGWLLYIYPSVFLSWSWSSLVPVCLCVCVCCYACAEILFLSDRFHLWHNQRKKLTNKTLLILLVTIRTIASPTCFFLLQFVCECINLPICRRKKPKVEINSKANHL